MPLRVTAPIANMLISVPTATLATLAPRAGGQCLLQGQAQNSNSNNNNNNNTINKRKLK
jgi:hypothetical protein